MQSCAQLVASITAPLRKADTCNHNPEHVVASSSSSGESSSGDSDSEVIPLEPLPPLPSQLVRPQVGMKTPKSSFPPTKCINVHCKEEKRELKRQVESLKEEIEDCKYCT